MHIDRVIIKNYRCLRNAEVSLQPTLNVIVGNNECGKSTLLEAINLALTGLLNGRPILAELHPYLFNASTAIEYLVDLREGKAAKPPSILIELYLAEHVELTKLKGSINSQKVNCPGITLSVEFNPDFAEEFAAYVKEPKDIATMPMEYYTVHWRSFADQDLMARSIAIKAAFIDASTIRQNTGANRYIVDVVKDGLDSRQQVDLALSYRIMKDKFLQEPRVKDINEVLRKKNAISEKVLSVSLDVSARAGWEASVMAHLDEVPLTLVGRGEQSCIKIKLALENSAKTHVALIEEAENHLSHSRLNELIAHIAEKRSNKQLLITTHSSFVLNKLGVESVLLFDRGKSTTLEALDKGTHDYFMKLPGYDTLRLILSKRVILVEGPSDDLIVQIAYYRKHGKLPIQDHVDVMSVRSLAFKRFLEIAKLLDVRVDVITDNDGKYAAIKDKYKDYEAISTITINADSDEAAPTLEPQLLKANSLATINKILKKTYSTDAELLHFMENNKADCALAFFETKEPWNVPKYIEDAVQ